MSGKFASAFGFAAIAAASPAAAGNDHAVTLLEFDGATGYAPGAGIITDAQGNIFGDTTIGGTGPCSGGAGCGTIYELSPPASKHGSWTFTKLHDFQGGADGEVPFDPLAQDQAGNLYGYAYGSPGTVFEASPPAHGRSAWTYNVIYTFTGGSDGDLLNVQSPLLPVSGDLYGVASGGSQTCGQTGCGSVFRLTFNGSAWQQETLYSFTGGRDGGEPNWIAGPDASGAFYISTSLGNGAIVQLAPQSGAWHATVINAFKSGGNLQAPGNLIVSPDGNVYGIASSNHGGVVFQLTPPQSGSHWTRTVIAHVDHHRYGPTSLALRHDGSFIGAIEGDFDFYAGGIFQLTPSGGGWTYSELANFNRGPDRNPLNAVDGFEGHIYGVFNGGDSSSGSLFKAH